LTVSSESALSRTASTFASLRVSHSCNGGERSRHFARSRRQSRSRLPEEELTEHVARSVDLPPAERLTRLGLERILIPGHAGSA